MKKEVIYIDIEDDITAVIDKVKAVNDKIVALVPPKRADALMSAVNLKLLQKAAKSVDKHVVLITNNHTIRALAASAQIPVAKNLQSKPEIVSTDAPSTEGDDVINGEEVAVGDHAGLKDNKKDDSEQALAAVQKSGDTPKNRKTPKGIKIPDFSKFRKWLFIGVGALILLIAFLIWAIWFAPRATVTVTAQTTDEQVDIPLFIEPEGETDLSSSVVKPVTQEVTKEQSADFTATGEKEVGEKATGSMTLTNSSDSDSVEVEEGTRFRADNLIFTSDRDVTVPGARVSGGSIVPGEANVPVTAEEIGSEYNLSSQSYRSSNSDISARGGNMTGGSKRTVTVVTQEDVDTAINDLGEQNEDEMRQEVASAFEDNIVPIGPSFTVDTGDPQVDPGVDSEAENGTVTVETTYRMYGASKDNLADILDEYLKEQMRDNEEQRIYENGLDDIEFTNYEEAPGGTSVRIETTGHIGPNINENELAEQIEGMRVGEVQEEVEGVIGVENVDVSLWPFWVTKVPNPDKTTIEFNIASSNDND